MSMQPNMTAVFTSQPTISFSNITEHFITVGQSKVLLVSATCLFIALITLTQWVSQYSKRVQLPMIGLRRELFPHKRVTLRNLLQGDGLKNLLSEGYHQFTKSGKAFILPCYLNGNTVILPKKHASTIANAPNTELNPYPVVHEYLQEKYTLPVSPNEELLVEIIRKHLTGTNLGAMLPVLQDEVEKSIDDVWGLDENNWKSIRPWPTTIEIATRSLNRVVSGLPLCRNSVYVHSLVRFMYDVLINAMIIKAFPRILRWPLSRLIARKANKNLQNLTKLVLPVVEERLRQMEKKAKDADMDWEAPNDFITWQIEASFRHKNAFERTPLIICERLNLLNHLAGHTSPSALSNFLIDFFSLPKDGGHIELLREETEREYAECGGQWTLLALAKLAKLDSSLKESFRLHPLGIKTVERMVMKTQGYRIDNLTLPKGTVVAIPNWDIHTDKDEYENPYQYDPFRFFRPLEDNSLAESVDARRRASGITASPEFLHFGLGRHACPGRFIAMQLLKMDIAYILMNYDVQEIKNKPATIFRNMALLPQTNFEMKVKRKQGTVKKK